MNQSRLKILFLSPRFPFPLIGGDHVKCYHLLKHLSTNHDVTLVTFNHGDKPSQEQINSIEGLGVRLVALPLYPYKAAMGCVRTLFTDMPLEIAFYYGDAFAEAVEKLCSENQFDLGISFFMRSAEYIRHKNFPKILVAEDCRTMYQQRSFEVRRPAAKSTIPRASSNCGRRMQTFLSASRAKESPSKTSSSWPPTRLQ